MDAARHLLEDAVAAAIDGASLAVDESDVNHWKESRPLFSARLRVEADNEISVGERTVEEGIRIGTERNVRIERHSIITELDRPGKVPPALPPEVEHMPLSNLPFAERVVNARIASAFPQIAAVPTRQFAGGNAFEQLPHASCDEPIARALAAEAMLAERFKRKFCAH